MRATVLPPALIAAAITVAYVVLHLAIPSVGVDQAVQATHTMCAVGAAGLTANFVWTIRTILRRRRR